MRCKGGHSAAAAAPRRRDVAVTASSVVRPPAKIHSEHDIRTPALTSATRRPLGLHHCTDGRRGRPEVCVHFHHRRRSNQ